ncbi:hypothetical protein FACS189449_10150 [Alphaproteobacteria bacterium]|nr:hypothetical protein FACS189449_10150 [Alphaproteobacteria bacterium]
MQKFVSFVTAFFVVCAGCVSGMDEVGTASLRVDKTESGCWGVGVEAANLSEIYEVPADKLVTPGESYTVDLDKFGKVHFEIDKNEKVSFVMKKSVFLFSKIFCLCDYLIIKLNKENIEKLNGLISAKKIEIGMKPGCVPFLESNATVIRHMKGGELVRIEEVVDE